MKRYHYIIALLAVSLSAYAEYWTPTQYEDSIRAAFHREQWDHGRDLLVQADPDYGTLSTFCCLNGRYFYHLRDYEEARRYLILAMRDDDANTEALELLVRVERETENYTTAISHVNHMLEFAPYDVGLWRQKIEFYRLIGNDVEADRLLERLYLIYPDDTLVMKDMVYQHQMRYYQLHRGGYTAAEEEALKQILRVDPKNREANEALNHLQRKRYNEIFARDQLNREREHRYYDSLNVIRTAKMSATLTLQAIRNDEAERQQDPDALAARMLHEAGDLIADEQYYDALRMLDVVDSIASEPDILESSARRRRTCEALLAEREQRRWIGDAIDTSYVCLKQKRAAEAVVLLDSVLVLDPKHNEARYVHSLADEQLKRYDSAYHYLNSYHPLPEEVFMTRRHLHTLAMRAHRNTLNFEYQYARRSSKDELTHNAYAQYAHNWKRETFGAQLAYAGRETDTETGKGGGTGVLVGLNWSHYCLAVPLELDVHATWASRFFPHASAGIRFTEELPREWSLTEKLDYRRIHTEDDNYHLVSLGLSTTKTIERFSLTPALDAYLMLSPTTAKLNWGLYFNGSLKFQYAFLEGDRSSVFAAVGVGNAPEATLLQNSIRVEFARLNTYVSGGINWVVCDNLAAGFSTSWYALGQQTAGQTAVRNYLYIHANLLISF